MALGVSGKRTLVTVRGDSAAPAMNPRAAGLFHLAVDLHLRQCNSLVGTTDRTDDGVRNSA